MSRIRHRNRGTYDWRPEPAARSEIGWRFVDTPIRSQATGHAALESPRHPDEREDPLLIHLSTAGTIIGGVIGGVIGAVGGFLVGGVPGAIVGGLGGALVGGAIGRRLSGPTLSKSNDTYTDTAATSKKDVRFDVGVPSDDRAADYALVNWVKGFARTGGGGFFKARLYGSMADVNFSSFQVDSMDADPVYWSDTGGRWNYVSTPGGFYATDSPGPARATQRGAEFALQFQMGLYRLADLPATTTGTISATPLSMVPWQFSVKVDAGGRFTHPTL